MQALYRKYRSKSLSEIVGQEHITDTLTRALAAGRISHAYLFSGPRGVGKTSIARILAHEINGLPYTDDSMHLDIIEIDAASNRRIDEIRELRDKVYMAPTSGKYKVYIIDEVHMLTREAFNALLKTLEEPPAHVVFILATTEAHKLPETIVSRTQHYTFRPVESTKVIAHLRDIAASEGLAIDDDALELLAAHGQGSFRDSISVLDQASGIHTTADTQVITADDVRQLLGIAPAAALDRIIELLANASTAGEVLNQLSSLYSQGIRAGRIASQLSERLRQQLIMGASELPVDTTLRLMKSLIEVPASRDPERLFELILLESLPPSAIKTTHPTPNTTLPEASKPTPTIESIVLAAVPKTEATKPPMPIVARPPAVPDTAPSNTAAAPALKQAEAKTPTADIVEVSDDNIPSTAPTAISVPIPGPPQMP